MISSLDLLPEVSTLIIWTVGSCDFEVNFHLEYETTTTTASTSATTQLRHFCFQFDQRVVELLKEKFKDQLDTDGLIIGESHKTGEKKEMNWVIVTVKKSFDRSHLLRTLIPMAPEIPR